MRKVLEDLLSSYPMLRGWSTTAYSDLDSEGRPTGVEVIRVLSPDKRVFKIMMKEAIR